jgi:hypothetical protein
VEVVQLGEAAEFLARAGPQLLADEARHNLILGIAGSIRDNPRLYPRQTFWLVEHEGEVAGAALRTPPYNLVLARGGREALEALARSIDELPGVVGAVPEVETFARVWTEMHGGRAEVRSEQGVYAADGIVPPARPAAGAPRAAVEADRPLLLDWWRAFEREALGETEIDEERNNRSLEHRLTTRGNGIALWEVGGKPVSLAGYGSPTPRGVRIGPVYTPPEHRGRGYASALTAHVSSEQLAAGRSFCFLYTDLANPTSNKIYAEIGYRRVCDAIQYAFV